MTNSRNHPIGVFDSGLGGLTVVKEIVRQLPFEDVVYFGDTARVPYGTKSKESIVRFSKENVAILLKHKVKIVVVACNTSSSLALTELRQSFPDLPIVGVIKPGARKAVETTRNERVGIIATSATIKSGEYTREIKVLNPEIKVAAQACPLFVPLVEEGWTDKKVTVKVAEEYLEQIKKTNIDTLILGCTHYPLLKQILRQVMGRGVMLVDSAQEVALEVKKLLEYTQQNSVKNKKSRQTFLVSDEPKHFSKLARRFLGFSIKDVMRCDHV